MKKKFKARIKHEGSALGWKIVDIPFDVKKVFGIGGRLPVKGTVNGFAFASSLFPRKDGLHFLMLNKLMQKGADVSALGEMVEIELEHDPSIRTVTTPPILKKILSEEDGLLAYYNSLNYSTRKWIADAITQTKSIESQKRKAETIAVQIYEMKEGETIPPPILQAVFARNAKARAGWELFTASQKRGHLWGIFYYKNPASRHKRLDQAVMKMVEYYEKAKLKDKSK
jgi:uncharacterized protein YdeI (YjbR/CyaY-like superfamily)